MTYRKFIAAAVAATTAVVPMFSSRQAAFAKTKPQSEYPSWIPTDFESALEFSNTYGTTRVEDEFLCVVFRRGYDTSVQEGIFLQYLPYEVHYDQSGMRRVSAESYPSKEKLGKDDLILDVYVFSALNQGTFSITLKSPYDERGSVLHNGETKYTFDIADNFQVAETDDFSWLPDCKKEYEEFVKKNGRLSVKDNYIVFCLDQSAGTAFSWEPKDCEYEKILKYLGSYNCSEVTPEPLDGGEINSIEVYKGIKDGDAEVEWNYIPALGKYEDGKDKITADCTVFDDAKSVLLAGQTRITVLDKDTGKPFSDDILANHPFSFGTDIRIGDMYTGPVFRIEKNPEYVGGDLAKLFYIADEFNFICDDQPEITKFDNGALDLVFKTKLNITGDANKDGSLGVADVVLLQKWLLNQRIDGYFDWKAADLCTDNKLDIFDLVMLRKKLVEADISVSEEAAPVLVVTTEATWRGRQDILIYDENGAAYHVNISDGKAFYGPYDAPYIEEDAELIKFGRDGWYEVLESIITKPESRYYDKFMDEGALSLTKQMSKETVKYSEEKWLESMPHWLDGSTMSIYLVNRTEDEAHFAKLATLLASDSCLDNEQVQDYVRELLKKDYVDYPELDSEFENFLKYSTKN